MYSMKKTNEWKEISDGNNGSNKNYRRRIPPESACERKPDEPGSDRNQRCAKNRSRMEGRKTGSQSVEIESCRRRPDEYLSSNISAFVVHVLKRPTGASNTKPSDSSYWVEGFALIRNDRGSKVCRFRAFSCFPVWPGIRRSKFAYRRFHRESISLLP